MKMLNDWNFWLSIITAVVAVAAIFQTQRQIKISNKQSLFDNRIKIYTIIVKLVQTYKECPKSDFSKTDHFLLLPIRIDLIWLTNTFFLFPIQKVIEEPPQEPVSDVTNIFNELDEIAETATLIFSGSEAKIASNFVHNYRWLLLKMLLYQDMKRKLDKYIKQTRIPLESAKEDVHETDLRKEVIIAYEDLKESYDAVEEKNIMEKLRNQIKL